MDNVNVNANGEGAKKIKKRRGSRVALTTIGYVLIIVFLLAVLPVVLPPIFGYHTRNVDIDHSGAVWEVLSVAYYKDCNISDLDSASYVATDGFYTNKNVDVYLITAVGVDSVKSDDGDVIPASAIRGIVRAKTPYIGLFTGLCFSTAGIVALVLIFAIGLACMILANKISKEVNQEVYKQKQSEKA